MVLIMSAEMYLILFDSSTDGNLLPGWEYYVRHSDLVQSGEPSYTDWDRVS